MIKSDSDLTLLVKKGPKVLKHQKRIITNSNIKNGEMGIKLARDGDGAGADA